MPNWCSNSLIVEGKSEDVAKFAEAAKGHVATYNDDMRKEEAWPIFDEVRKEAYYASPPPLGTYQEFCMNAIVPVPDDIRRFGFDTTYTNKIRKELGEEESVGGYDWQVDNWGTKWDIHDYDIYYTDDDNVYTVEFPSAWAPPIEFVKSASSIFPTLEFHLDFSEPGNNFAGERLFKSGVCIFSEDRECECSYCGKFFSNCKCL